MPVQTVLIEGDPIDRLGRVGEDVWSERVQAGHALLRLHAARVSDEMATASTHPPQHQYLLSITI